MDNRVERVAKAICAAGNHTWPTTDGYNDRAEKRYFQVLARAAMEALAEPTEDRLADACGGSDA